MMTVVVNGETRHVEPASTVEALVEALGCGRRGVAVAVNLEIVARSAWPATVLQPGDRVEILRAAQGGC